MRIVDRLSDSRDIITGPRLLSPVDDGQSSFMECMSGWSRLLMMKDRASEVWVAGKKSEEENREMECRDLPNPKRAGGKLQYSRI